MKKQRLFKLDHLLEVYFTKISIILGTRYARTVCHGHVVKGFVNNPAIGAFESQAGISRGTPNTKRSDTRLGFGSTVWCSNRDMPNGSLELLPRNLEINSVYRGTSRACESSAPKCHIFLKHVHVYSVVATLRWLLKVYRYVK